MNGMIGVETAIASKLNRWALRHKFGAGFARFIHTADACAFTNNRIRLYYFAS